MNNIIISIFYQLKKLKYIIKFYDAKKGVTNKDYYSSLDTFNPTLYKNRSKIYLRNSNNKMVVQKTFLDTLDGKIAFKNEEKAFHLFNKFEWYPKVIEIGHNYIIYEFIHNKFRLDNLHKLINQTEKDQILQKILDIILVLFQHNISHRDIHAKNIFYINNKVILTDFETMDIIKNDVDLYDSHF